MMKTWEINARMTAKEYEVDDKFWCAAGEAYIRGDGVLVWYDGTPVTILIDDQIIWEER